MFGYYAGPDPNKGAIECSWFCNKEHGLLASYVHHHADSPTYPNHHMVTVSGETNKESSKIDSVNFIFDNSVEDSTDVTLPAISYKDDINTIQHFNNIIDHNILFGKYFYYPRVRTVILFILNARPVLPSLINIRICS